MVELTRMTALTHSLMDLLRNQTWFEFFLRVVGVVGLLTLHLALAQTFQDFLARFVLFWTVLVTIVGLTYWLVARWDKTVFFLLGLLSAVLSYATSIPWTLGLVSQVFPSPGLATSLGILVKLNLKPIDNLLFILSTIADLGIALGMVWVLEKGWRRIGPKILVLQNLWATGKGSMDWLQAFELRSIAQAVLLMVVVVLGSLTYAYTMSATSEVTTGLTALTSGLADIQGLFGEEGLSIRGLLGNYTAVLVLKNILFDAGDSFEVAQQKLQSLHAPMFQPLLLSLGLADDLPHLLELVDLLSAFTGYTVPDVITAIDLSLRHMNLLTREILRRAYWWDLEEENVTYNPRIDFFSKLELSEQIIFDLQRQVDSFSHNVAEVKTIVGKTFLDRNRHVGRITDVLTDFADQLRYVIDLSRVGVPLLNATFTSVVVTNALASDQFVTAKALTDEAQKYVKQSQTLLDQIPPEEDMIDTINDILLTMGQFNVLNRQFAEMANATQLMFLHINESVGTLDSLHYPPNESPPRALQISQTNQSLYKTYNLVQEGLNLTEQYINQDVSVVRFPFRDIFRHFQWFFDGYEGAVAGTQGRDSYRHLWNASEQTIELFTEVADLVDSVEILFNTSRDLGVIPNDVSTLELLASTNDLTQKIMSTTDQVSKAVVNGSILVNLTCWENVLGLNSTTQLQTGEGFFQALDKLANLLVVTLNADPSFPTSFYLYYDIEWSNLTTTLQTINGSGIWNGTSQELG